MFRSLNIKPVIIKFKFYNKEKILLLILRSKYSLNYFNFKKSIIIQYFFIPIPSKSIISTRLESFLEDIFNTEL